MLNIRLKKIIKELICLPIYFLSFFRLMLSLISKKLEYIFKDKLYEFNEKIYTEINHLAFNNKHYNIKIYSPNRICQYRADTFSTKEKETLEWLEKYGSNKKTLLDIGANIGLYSIYHSLVNKGNVIACEPSFLNLKQLLKNINLNNCQNNIYVIPLALNETSGFEKFNYSNIYEGGALSSFGVDYGYDGKPMDTKLSINIPGFSLDKILENELFFHLKPDLIKIDVDGIEDKILKGANTTLNNPNLKSILIEVNKDFQNQYKNVQEILEKNGFYKDKNFDFIENRNNYNFEKTFNQIWFKK